MKSMTHTAHPTYGEIEDAVKRIGNDAHTTPVFRSRTFNRLTDTDAYFKAENLQRVGAFKIRGALNKIRSLSKEEKRPGVITYSSGNHAQATALAAQMEKIRCVVVMPEDARRSKRSAAEEYGADIVIAGLTSDDRYHRARELQEKFGYTMIPPYDDPYIIAGQGTCGLEILRQLPEVEAILVPVGGGGLIAGCALAVKSVRPDIRVIGVETEGADDANQSFRQKIIVKYESTSTIADGMRNLSVGNLTFDIMVQHVDDMLTVSDDDVRLMMRFFFERMKMVVEPTGAVAPAAVRVHAGKFTGKKVCAIISGGNIGIDDFFELLGSG
jgi:threo-3-hydroxy-L-aspartate ammonia-lyase